MRGRGRVGVLAFLTHNYCKAFLVCTDLRAGSPQCHLQSGSEVLIQRQIYSVYCHEAEQVVSKGETMADAHSFVSRLHEE